MKRILILSLTLLLLSAERCAAQSFAEAESAMKEFVQLYEAGGNNRGEAYKKLLACYAGFVSVVSTQTATPEYSKAHESLKIIYPYLHNAAAFYSQRGDQQTAAFFARACVDMPKMPAFQGVQFALDSNYPTIVYYAASNAYNSGDYESAARYYNEYLSTGDSPKRQNALHFLTLACQKSGNHQMAFTILDATIAAAPNDFNVLSMAINAALDAKDYQRLPAYVDKALKLRPNNQELLDIQGKMYEDMKDFENALKVFQKKKELTPNSLSAIEHIAQNYYNLGAVYYNKALLEANSQTAKRLKESSDNYFRSAVKTLKEVLIANPASLKYTQALATAYSCLADARQLEATNFKLQTLGGQKVDKNVNPAIITSGQEFLSQPARNEVAAVTSIQRQSTPTMSQLPVNDNGVPRFSAYARKYIQQHLEKWQQKDAYETVDEYRKRVSDENQQKKLEELQRLAEREYIIQYSHDPRFSELHLMPYDAENQAFLISSDYGNMVLPVPRQRDEARIFEAGWNGMKFVNPRYFIDGDSLALASLTFVTPAGKSYQYDNKQALEYLDTHVNVELAQVDYDHLDLKTGKSDDGSRAQIKQKTVAIGTSDVDKNIPQTKTVNDKTFAVIIANENYRQVPHVAMAVNDGTTFAKYCQQTLGLPEVNIRMYPDATLGSMMNAVKDITDICKAYNGDVNVIFYYAGHGIPDEATRDAYLLPVDADGRQMSVCYPLRTLYDELSLMGAKSVVVFLDACFSGSTPDGGHLMTSARGIAMKPRQATPQGNMVVFSAASDAETAFPYEEKGHGLFTYFLLKKLQESKGNATLRELGDYVTKNVREKSVVVNRKAQTPTVVPASAVSGSWESMKLK